MAATVLRPPGSPGGSLASPTVEALAEALVREYFKAHCCINTAAAFEVERPRKQDSVTNKKHVREALGFHSTPDGPRSLLESFVMQRMAPSSPSRPPPDTLDKPHLQPPPRRPVDPSVAPAPPSGGRVPGTGPRRGSSFLLPPSFPAPPPPPPGPSSEPAQPQHPPLPSASSEPTPAQAPPPLPPRVHLSAASGPPPRKVSSWTEPDRPTSPARPSEVRGRSTASAGVRTDPWEVSDVDASSDASSPPHGGFRPASGGAQTPGAPPAPAPASAPAPAPAALAVAGGLPFPSQSRPASAPVDSAPPGPSQPAAEQAEFLPYASRCRNLLFGKTPIQASWRQGLLLCPQPGLHHGLVQLFGGPCGVLAAVQAWMLKILIDQARFEKILSRIQGTDTEGAQSRVPREVAQAALWRAVAAILWQAGDEARAAWVFPRSVAAMVGAPLSEVERESRVSWHESLDSLEEAIRATAPAFSSNQGYGMVLFVYSALLSRGIDETRGDMDDPSTALIGAHSYCTQELVQLLACGRASSNAFDGERLLDGEARLRGVRATAPVGFLSLFEWHGSMEVGSFLKHPSSPVWVVSSESHYSVMWSPDGRATADGGKGRPPFTIHYWDQLANQDEVIRLTATPAADGEKMEDDYPLENVLRTRWPRMKVDWNGTEPLL